MNKTSTLRSVINDFYAMTDLDTAKEFIIDHINQSKINDDSKRVITIRTQQQTNLIGLQKYITNSMFRFEKMGL